MSLKMKIVKLLSIIRRKYLNMTSPLAESLCEDAKVFP